MACSQTLAGIARDCAANMGGIKRVLLANRADVASITLTSGKVSAITMESSKKFYEYNFKPGTSSMTSNWQVNRENGVKYVQTDLVMVFNRMETTKRVEVEAMAQADLYAIVEDNNGLYWLLGLDNPLELSAGDGPTGTARTDRNGYSVTLQDDSKGLPTEILTGTGGVDVELHKVGLYLINANITDIRDASGYIAALGQEAAARAINDAMIKVAEETRRGEIGKAEALREQTVQVAMANAAAVEGNNEAQMKVADSNARLKVRQAEAARIALVAEKEQAAQAEAAGYIANREAEMKRAELERATQTANEIVKAEIQKRKQEIAAEAVHPSW